MPQDHWKGDRVPVSPCQGWIHILQCQTQDCLIKWLPMVYKPPYLTEMAVLNPIPIILDDPMKRFKIFWKNGS